MPQLIEGIASWIDGKEADALEHLRTVASAHALERHRGGHELTVALEEYTALRGTLLEVALEAAGKAELASGLVALATALDRTIAEAVTRYEAEHDHVRERFIGMLVHDLRDPLTAVVMSANLLADMTLGERQAQLVGRITRGARRIERMVDEVVDFARSRLGEGMLLTPASFDMTDICNEAIAEARAMPAPRDIQLDVAGNVSGTWDRERARQALANLLTNAAQASQGPIKIRAHESSDQRAVIVSVTNRGAVIAPDVLARIFDPFARAVIDPARVRGLGLGLYMVEQIAIAHGGAVRATSTAAEGTT
ncbi:MAG: HAMP domain-containing histidine kinase, partial [Deltaproteobacteria bacterium]|nr:HAMP domain-containing histidine kinase [Deltaproteobacteria bacterium]